MKKKKESKEPKIESGLLSEIHKSFLYARKNRIDIYDISTWDEKYIKRMQKIAGILDDFGQIIDSDKGKKS